MDWPLVVLALVMRACLIPIMIVAFCYRDKNVRLFETFPTIVYGIAIVCSIVEFRTRFTELEDVEE